MTDRTLLVRHTAVARRWAGRCYGHSDMGLSRVGQADARRRAIEIAKWHPTLIVHSDLSRTRMLAQRIAVLAGVPCIADQAWRERDFGTWEGRSWTSIYRDTGNAMDGMINTPTSFRPGGGETTAELATRALAALRALPKGRVVVVAHGGPIASIRGLRAEAAVDEWASLIPMPGEAVELCSSASDQIIRFGEENPRPGHGVA